MSIVNNFIKDIIDSRMIQIKENKSSFDKDKIIIIVIIGLIFSFITFTFYRVIQTLQKLKETTADLTSINNEFVLAKNNIENSNWILDKSAVIAESINGLDDEREICQVVINILNKQIQAPAIAFYVRKPDSFIFKLCGDHGLNKNSASKNLFLEMVFWEKS